eukprot:7776778-Pyramimonas_sp.AAC.1
MAALPARPPLGLRRRCSGPLLWGSPSAALGSAAQRAAPWRPGAAPQRAPRRQRGTEAKGFARKERDAEGGGGGGAMLRPAPRHLATEKPTRGMKPWGPSLAPSNACVQRVQCNATTKMQCNAMHLRRWHRGGECPDAADNWATRVYSTAPGARRE